MVPDRGSPRGSRRAPGGTGPVSPWPYGPGSTGGVPRSPCSRRNGRRSRRRSRAPRTQLAGAWDEDERPQLRARHNRWTVVGADAQLRCGRDGRWWPYRKEHGRWTPAGPAGPDPAAALAVVLDDHRLPGRGRCSSPSSLRSRPRPAAGHPAPASPVSRAALPGPRSTGLHRMRPLRTRGCGPPASATAVRPRRGRCCGPCRRRRRRGRARRSTSTRGRADRGGGTGPAAGSGYGLASSSSGVHLQPGQARQPHLRPQPQQMAALDLLDAPEVQRVADPQPVRVPAAAPQPHPAGQAVRPAAHRPCEGEGVPAVLAPDALDHRPQGLRGGVDGPFPPVGVEAAAGPVGVGGQGVAGRAGHRSGGPAGGDLGVPDPLERQGERLVDADRGTRRTGYVRGDVVFVADDFVAQRLGERPGDGARYRRDQADPVAREPGGQDRHGDDEAPGQPGHRRVPAHHVAVRDDVGAADVEGAVHVGGHGGAADEVAQDVADGDALDAGAHPAGRDHDRQPLGEVTEHFEGGGAGADDDGGAQHGRRHPGVQQDLPHLGARAQMGRQLPFRHVPRCQPAEVDDAADACGAGLLPEDLGGPAVGALEAGSRAERVVQVVRDVDVPHRLAHRLLVGDVTAYHLGTAGPGVVAQFLRRTGQTAHPVPGGEQFGDQPAADVAGGPGGQAPEGGCVVPVCHCLPPVQWSVDVPSGFYRLFVWPVQMSGSPVTVALPPAIRRRIFRRSRFSCAA